MLGGGAGLGSGSAGRGAHRAGTLGCAAWVLAGVLLAAALVLPVGSSPPGRPQASPAPPEVQDVLGAAVWTHAETSLGETAVEAPSAMKSLGSAGVSHPLPRRAWPHSLPASWPTKRLLKRESSRQQEEAPWALREALGHGVTFQKCAVGSGQHGEPMAQVRILVNNSRVPAASDLSDLLLLDNVTGLRVRGSSGTRTAQGLQVFRRKLLPAGDSFSVSYTASLEPGSLGDGESLQLPALLLFQSRTQNRTQLVAPFTVTAEEQIRVLPSHGLHAAAFLGVLLLFLVLTWVSGVLLIRRHCWTGDLLFWRKARSQEHRLEQSQLTSEADLEEDLALSDQMVGVLCSEDPGGMLQALEELEIATLRRADAALEACRTQVSKDIIGLLLRGLASKSQLSPQAEGALAAAFQKQFLWLDREIREEHGRKVVALVAEAELEAQKRMERQQQREMAASEGLEKLLRHADERQASECSALLRTLQGLEQEQLRRSLALQQEEDSAQSRRQLAVLQRTELHRIFFTQIQGAVRKGGLQPQAAEELLRDYSRAQEALEEALDVLQATQRSHLSQRFDHREGLVLSIQSLETRVQGVLDAASAQLTLLIQKHERAGYLDGEQAGALLECTHTEVFAIKQKLEQEQKQQREKLQRQLVVRHRREMVQMHREQQRAQLAQGEAWRAAGPWAPLLQGWRRLQAEQGAAREALAARLDRAAREELRALRAALAARALDQLRRLQSAGLAQELRRRGAPWAFAQPLLDDAARELAARAGQLQLRDPDRARAQDGLRGLRARLLEDCLEEAAREQAELRAQELQVFRSLCSAPCSLSEEELLDLHREAHGCFAQMDRSLALPKIRAHVLLQRAEAAWREAEFLKLEEALAAPELQPPSKARKSRSKSKSKTELVKKCLEDKIQLFAAQAPEDLLDKVRAELQEERTQQLDALEAMFAEALVALQFQKAAEQAGTWWEHASLLCIRDLLLERLGEAPALSPTACTQALEPYGQKLQELEKKLEEKLLQEEAAGLRRLLDPGLPEGPEEVKPDRQLSAVLLGALSQGRRLLERQKQSLREERRRAVVLEGQLESMEADAYATLHSQELKLATSLSRLAALPGSTLRLLLSVTLPAVTQPELLTALDSSGQKQPEPGAEGEAGEPTEQGRKGKHQGWWQDLESRLRGEMVARGLETLQWARRRKESILKKPCPPLRERAQLSGRTSWPQPSPSPAGLPLAVSIVGAEALDLLDTGEKIFVFRNPAEPEIRLHLPPRRKKKKNFLNAKKAAWVQAME